MNYIKKIKSLIILYKTQTDLKQARSIICELNTYNAWHLGLKQLNHHINKRTSNQIVNENSDTFKSLYNNGLNFLDISNLCKDTFHENLKSFYIKNNIR